MIFDKTIKASDFLASITIIISVSALVLSWNKDQVIKLREDANCVRVAAAHTLAKLERLRLIESSLYSELQPTYVEISEMLLVKYDVIAPRDKLWKEINLKKADIDNRILNEEIETAYTDLIAYYPPIRKSFLDVLREIREIETNYTKRPSLTIRNLSKSWRHGLLSIGVRFWSRKPSSLV